VCAKETVMSGEKAMAAVETPQGEIERLRKVLDEVQTNQAEHAAHLDRLEHRTDGQRMRSHFRMDRDER
jgi:anti-sigma regulatory factor (Ser/Thr protein kinase)